jgi:hypothetical protein
MCQVAACEKCLSEDLRVELIQGPTDPECGYADSADFFTCRDCGHTSFECCILDADDEDEQVPGAVAVGGAALCALAAWFVVLFPIYLILP